MERFGITPPMQQESWRVENQKYLVVASSLIVQTDNGAECGPEWLDNYAANILYANYEKLNIEEAFCSKDTSILDKRIS